MLEKAQVGHEDRGEHERGAGHANDVGEIAPAPAWPRGQSAGPAPRTRAAGRGSAVIYSETAVPVRSDENSIPIKCSPGKCLLIKNGTRGQNNARPLAAGHLERNAWEAGGLRRPLLEETHITSSRYSPFIPKIRAEPDESLDDIPFLGYKIF